jgi:hypothetical protein
MDNTRIHIKHFGSFGNYHFNWTDPNIYKELGLTPIHKNAHPRKFEIVNEKLFGYAIIKYELSYESISEYKRNLIANKLKP